MNQPLGSRQSASIGVTPVVRAPAHNDNLCAGGLYVRERREGAGNKRPIAWRQRPCSTMDPWYEPKANPHERRALAPRARIAPAPRAYSRRHVMANCVQRRLTRRSQLNFDLEMLVIDL